MPLETVDVILLLIIAGFALAGLWFGFVHALGSLLGTVLGVYLAARYFTVLAGWLTNIFGWEGNAPKVLAFVVSFFVINRVVGFAFWFLEKFIGFFTRLPFVRSLNRLLGLLLGAAEGIISVGIVLYFIERFPLSLPFMSHLANSQVAPYAVSVVSVFLPLVPEAIKFLESTVDYVENRVVEVVAS